MCRSSARTSTATLPTDCAASEWMSTDGAAARTASAISPSGWTEPTSLLACMTLTSTVVSRSAPHTAAALTRPSPSTGT
eukprot:6717799-Prymnesium_polylepis.1